MLENPLRCRKYPFPFMQHGDSFITVGVDVNSLTTCAFYYRRRHKTDQRFVFRKFEQNGKTAYRCWCFTHLREVKILPIEKGVPILTRTRPHNGIFPMRTMKIGDSFYIRYFHDAERAYQYASKYKKAKEAIFTVRRWEDGWRCWRIK